MKRKYEEEQRKEANECHTNEIFNNRWKDTKRKATLISFRIFDSHERYSFRLCIRLIFGGFYLRSLASNLYFQWIKRLKLPIPFIVWCKILLERKMERKNWVCWNVIKTILFEFSLSIYLDLQRKRNFKQINCLFAMLGCLFGIRHTLGKIGK